MNYMDEFDPDWVGDSKISTLKRMAFDAQQEISTLHNAVASESGARVGKNITHEDQIKYLQERIRIITRENSISNLFFAGIITKEEAKALWDQYRSPDEENHRVADAAIDGLNNKHFRVILTNPFEL